MRSKCLAIGIIFLFLGTCIGSTIAQDSRKQSSRGNWLYVGGSGPGNYTSIQDAIGDAIGGDTVFVFDESSPYYENVVVNRQISLIGEDRDTTIIDAEHDGDVIILGHIKQTLTMS